jgi:hypothetical protein
MELQRWASEVKLLIIIFVLTSAAVVVNDSAQVQSICLSSR